MCFITEAQFGADPPFIYGAVLSIHACDGARKSACVMSTQFFIMISKWIVFRATAV